MAIAISAFLTVVINLMIISFLDIRHKRMKNRCRELKEYIKFLETSHRIEDAHEGAQWLEERAQRRLSCDIQDLNK